jgi:hypothetical protein
MIPGTFTGISSSEPMTMTYITHNEQSGGTGSTVACGSPSAGDLITVVRTTLGHSAGTGTGFTLAKTGTWSAAISSGGKEPSTTYYSYGMTVSYKIATGTEGTSIGGFSNASQDSVTICRIDRPSKAITSIVPSTILFQAINGTPSAQTNYMANVDTSVVGFTLYGAASNTDPTYTPSNPYTQGVGRAGSNFWHSVQTRLYPAANTGIDVTFTANRSLTAYGLMSGHLKVY